MVTAERPLVILDACVLIDLAHIDRGVLADVCKALGSIHVVRTVFDAVKQIDEATAATLGMNVVEPLFADVVEAARSKTGALSFQDKLCLLLAQRHNWACVTNSKPLRDECSSRRVAVLWALELLAFGAPNVSATDLEAAAWAINSKNPRSVSKASVEAYVEKMRQLQ